LNLKNIFAKGDSNFFHSIFFWQMSKFVVSALKYRPARFDEVVGQEHVSQTLKNALQSDHLAHAFLFCGPRGIGKTTCARILAKALNCRDVAKDFEPCNACESCQAFNENASFNIIELDAASNNSVEHIRALVEQVRFKPQQGKFKVFIIDEVHMLSQSAFNAFLKTLEEPPPYAIFILATTEKHKIIPTILSRCQIFDFKRIQIPEMVSHLENICKKEGIEADVDALHIIAQKADGSLRDALSIFDRIVSFSGEKISYEDVISNLNVLDYDYFFQFTNALLVQDLPNVMTIFDEVVRNGFEADIFVNELAVHFRNLLVCKDAQTLQLLEVSDSLKERYQKQAQIAPASFLLTALNLANDCDINYKMARHKRLQVEMTLIKMAYINQAVELAKMPPITPQNVASPQKKTLETNAPGRVEEPPPPSLIAEEEMAKKEKASEKKLPEKPVSEELDSPPIKKTSKKTELRNHSTLGTPKLNSLDELEEEVQEAETNGAAKQESRLSSENLKKTWQQYLQKQAKTTTKNILKNAGISLNGAEIIVTVGSSLAENTLRQENNLMEFLREELHAPSLEFRFKIDPEKALSKSLPKRQKPMTDSEKYWKMKIRNPLVDEMRKRFDLSIDND